MPQAAMVKATAKQSHRMEYTGVMPKNAQMGMPWNHMNTTSNQHCDMMVIEVFREVSFRATYCILMSWRTSWSIC